MGKQLLKVFGVLVVLFFSYQLPAMGVVFTASTTDELKDYLIAAAINGEDDTVYILPGEYYGQFVYFPADTEDHSLRLIGSGADQTFFSGNNAFYLGVPGTNAHVTIENITISNSTSGGAIAGGGVLFEGNASLTVTNCRFISNSAGLYSGGGLYAKTNLGTITIQGSLFENNRALRGGGIFVSAPNVVLEGNNIINNELVGMGPEQGMGCGVYIDGGYWNCSVTVRNNLFLGNETSLLGQGGGLYINGFSMNTIILEGNLFDQNKLLSGGDGGGAYIQGVDGPMNGIVLKSNKFKENSLGTGIDPGTGGGLYVSVFGSFAGPLTALNNVFARNDGRTAGGAYLYNFDGSVIFTNNTSYGNQSGDLGGDVTIGVGSTADIYNNILWDMDDGQDIDIQGFGTANLCSNDIRNYTPGPSIDDCGDSNINVDPLLIEYRISEQSPAAIIDSGDSYAPGIPDVDIDKEARIIGSAVDMGADEYNNKAPFVWQEAYSVYSPNGGGAYYGYALDIDGDTLVVGEPRLSTRTGHENAGAVHVYRRRGDGPYYWAREQSIEIPDFYISNPVGAQFGYSVAIEGNTIVVGAPGLLNNNNPAERVGGVYIYQRGEADKNPWYLRNTTFGDEINGKLGYSVAISGNTIVAGAPYYQFDDTPTRRPGAAFVFKKHPEGFWLQIQILSPYDLGWGLDQSVLEFGSDVSVSGDLVVVGAPGKFIAGFESSGAVYTFQRVDDLFYLVDEIFSGAFDGGYKVGKSLSIFSNTLAVDSLNGYSVFEYPNDDSGWFWDDLYMKIYPSSELPSSGKKIDIYDTWLVRGDYQSNEVYIHYKYYRPDPENIKTWHQVQTIAHPPDGFETSQFGWATAIYGSTFVVGDPVKGRVYIYEFPHPTFESPNEYTESATHYGIISQAEAQEYEYDNLNVQDIVGTVAFGSTFRLEVFDPSGSPYGDPIESSVSPITIDIPDAVVGKWKFKITAVQSVDDNHYTFTILVRDSDNDGIPDVSDNCPDIANPGQEDSDGDGIGDACEAIDSDGDGVSDDQDNCPYISNPGQEDSDGDGVGDSCDGCPADPDKTAPGICGCGIGDTDIDGDGVFDCIDGCPSDPNKTEPGDCGCGVADEDSDGDGTADCIDGCPDDPDKIDPGACGCGVIDIDSDNDGTPDCNDLCPYDSAKIEPGNCGCGISEDDCGNDDTIPPEISITVSPGILWPPNHKMVPINVTVTVSDDKDPNPSYHIESIVMNEGDETNTYEPGSDVMIGDGNTTNDIQIDSSGNISLRAERSGKGNGRIYTITYIATDAAGNTTTESAVVLVPHNR